MLCPNCKKSNTSLISSQPLTGKSSIVRKRHCICGYEFETVEMPKKILKKRKIDNRIKWSNYRFKMYVENRFIHLMYDLVNFPEKIQLLANNVKVIKENRKLKIIVTTKKNGKLTTKKYNARPRTNTIDQVLIYKEYWTQRFKIFPKLPVDDMKIKNQVKIEKRLYEKSIVNHLLKRKYNNKDFMISCFDKDKTTYKHALACFKNEKFWEIWQKII